MDVPVNMQLKFQQFYEFDILVPQFQFIVRVLDISAVPQRQVRTVPNCAGTVKTSQVQFLGDVGRARRCATKGAGDGPDSADNRVGAAVGGGGVAGSLDSQVTCHQLVSVTDVASWRVLAIPSR